MSTQRFVRAARELAEALQEIASGSEFEVVGHPSDLPSTSSAGFSGAAPTAPPELCASSGTEEPGANPPCSSVEVRHYIILKHPKGLIGYIAGPSPATWWKVEETLPNQRLAGSGARLRRVADKKEAQEVWSKQFPGKPMPLLVL